MPRFSGYNSSAVSTQVKATSHASSKAYGIGPSASFSFACRDDESDEISTQLDGISGVTYVKTDMQEQAKLFKYDNIAAKGAADVHASIQANALFSAFTSPVFPRNLCITFGAGWDGGNITVVGTNQFNQAVSETFVVSLGAVVVGTKIFKTVTSATFTAGTAGGTKTASIGSGDKLGITANVIGAFGKLDLAGVGEAVTIDATYDAFTPTTVPDGAVDYTLLVNC